MAVVDGFESGREFHTDTRIVDFTEETTHDKAASKTESKAELEEDFDSSWYYEPWQPVARHMAATLLAAGFKSSVDEDDNTTWDFTSDASVDNPPDDPKSLVKYKYSAIELRSPALYFTPESVKEVQDVLKLLKRTYCINTNGSTGLHVHVGDGRKGWQFHIIHKLFAFAWAFEYQLNTLFLPSRIDGEFTKGMRTSAAYVREFRGNRGRRPTPMEGLVALLNCDSYADLHRLFMPGTFRVTLRTKDRNNKQNKKPTVEWRHHEGTMDEVHTVMWIKTVVGIMEFLRSVKPDVFSDLLSLVEHERWEKMGDGLDGQRECEMGPILAEGEFTIIDLLQIMGLYQPAKFYKERGLYKILKDFDFKSRDNPLSCNWLHSSDPKSTASTGDPERADTSGSEEELEMVDQGRLQDTEGSETSEDIEAQNAAVDRFLTYGM
jgi:hypothetical protein